MDKIRNTTFREILGTNPVPIITIEEGQNSWLGHVLRMERTRIVRKYTKQELQRRNKAADPKKPRQKK